MGRCFQNGSLYVLLTSGVAARPLLEVVEDVLRGGADVVQLREKDLSDRELLEAATAIRRMTRERGTCFIVNDRPDIAVLADADGVHLGQEDMSLSAARTVVGPGRLIGISTHALTQAEAAAAGGADYIGVGPVFPTQTKGYEQGLGPEYVRSVKAAVGLPLVAIGGINLENVPDVLRAGADCAAVCSAILGADDVRSATEGFRAVMAPQKAGSGKTTSV